MEFLPFITNPDNPKVGEMLNEKTILKMLALPEEISFEIFD